MNTVTQQNAANSEETASAAEELSGQSLEMLGLVDTFTLSNERAKSNAFETQKPLKNGKPSSNGKRAFTY
jgi:methyl-accepting chemotaxis protein